MPLTSPVAVAGYGETLPHLKAHFMREDGVPLDLLTFSAEGCGGGCGVKHDGIVRRCPTGRSFDRVVGDALICACNHCADVRMPVKPQFWSGGIQISMFLYLILSANKR